MDHPHRHALSPHPSLVHNPDRTIQYDNLFRMIMPDGLRISDSAIARAVTEQQSLLPWLQDPRG